MHHSGIFEFYEVLHSNPSVDNYPSRVAEALAKLLPFEFACYAEVDTRRGHVISHDFPHQLPGSADGRARYLQQHPLWATFVEQRDIRAHRVADHASHLKFLNTALFNTVYRPMDCDRQLVVPLVYSPEPCWRHVALHRRRTKFSDDELSCIRNLNRALPTAYEHAYTATQLEVARNCALSIAEQNALPLFIVSKQARLRAITDCARLFLIEHFGPLPRYQDSLPTALREAVHAHLLARDRHPLAPIQFTVSAERPPSASVQVQGFPARDGHAMIFMLRSQTDPITMIMRTLKLPRRRSEVAHLVYLGHSNLAIADALGISVRTVETHLATVFKQLDLNAREVLATRIAAVLGPPAMV